MSTFIDRLKRLSRAASQQAIGFRAKQSASSRLKIQLVASFASESAEPMADYVAGADAGLLRISRHRSDAKTLQKVSQTMPDIPWGGWLQDSTLGAMKQMTNTGYDFIVFPATNTASAMLQDDEVGKILEVGTSLNEGLLRAANELPIDAVLIASGQQEGQSLTWHHLMLFRRFADLLTKPLLVSIPSEVTSSELQALWEAGINGVVIEVTTEPPQDRSNELRQVIDQLAFPSPHQRKKAEPLLPDISEKPSRVTDEEEQEED